MAEQIGIVLHNEKNGWARVVTDRKGACGGCKPSSGACSNCLANVKLESRVSNPINAKAGDMVKITLSSAVLLKGAAILYLLPIVLLIFGAFGGMWQKLPPWAAFGLSRMVWGDMMVAKLPVLWLAMHYIPITIGSRLTTYVLRPKNWVSI